MKYLLVDLNNSFFRARHSVSDPALVIHIILMNIRKAWMLFDANHVVIASDGRSWRKGIYSAYKAQRTAKKLKQTETEREIDESFFEALSDFVDFLKKRTNTTFLYDSILEADDLISEFIRLHPDDEHVIVSSDSDFKQLLSENVSIYDGMKGHIVKINEILTESGNPAYDTKGKQIKTDIPEWLLFEKCIRGDPGDNIFSAYPRVRKTQIRNAFDDRHERGYYWNNLMQQTWIDHKGQEHLVKDVYERNVALIDLSAQPEEIKKIMSEVVISALQTSEKRNQVGVHLMKFASKWSLQVILDQISSSQGHSFVDFLNQTYNGPYTTGRE
ncbi:MAG: hypothetical protein WC284_09500 [Candidimonas sp.]